MDKVIINGRIITPEGLENNAAVAVEKGLISEIGSLEKMTIPENSQIIDAGGDFLGPGLIDIHCHGGGGSSAVEDPEKMMEYHLKRGTTGILPTIPYTADREKTAEGLKRIRRASGSTRNSNFLGVHMEGPFINKKYGAGTSAARSVDKDEYEHILGLASDIIKIWTFAPELSGADGFAEAAAKQKIILSVGHSEASEEKIAGLTKKGLKLACHCMNAMGPRQIKRNAEGLRPLRVEETVMISDDIYAEVIPDSEGVHVPAGLLRLVLKAKGLDRVIIITDASYLKYPSCHPSSDLCFNAEGQLACTRMTMVDAIRNMMKHTGISIAEAFKMGALNPAVLLGIDEKAGSIEKGKSADILFLSEEANLNKVMFKGEMLEA